MPAMVGQATGPLSYIVRTPDGQQHRCQEDQLWGDAQLGNATEAAILETPGSHPAPVGVEDE